MKNIVFSTTRQWNCGDEFILFGCINLLQEVIEGEFNTIIYNRHPDLLHEFVSNDDVYASYNLCFNDNSLKQYTDASFIDLVVFAGTPEWSSDHCRTLYEIINKYNIPAIAVGIGIENKNDNQMIKDTISKFRLLTVRDAELVPKIDECTALYLPCPSIASANKPYEKRIEKVSKIALIYSCDISQSVPNNNVSTETYNYLIKTYRQLIDKYSDKYEFSIVCHYIDELPSATALFSNINCLYSYDAKDYFDIYGKHDFVIGCRVHGIGICASMGIPGLAIGHDFRAGSVRGFLAESITIDTGFDAFIKLLEKSVSSVSDKNNELLSNKRKTTLEYIDLITKSISDVLALPDCSTLNRRIENQILDNNLIKMIYETNRELKAVINSTSWKITKPLRAIKRFIKRCIKK